MAARPRCQPAAEGRELEGLGEVAQGVAVRAQLVLEHRPARAGLDAGRPRHGVDLHHTVERRQVNRHGTGKPVTDVALHAPHHRRPGAVGHGGRARVGAPVQDIHHVGLVAGPGHDVGRVLEATLEGAHHVAVGLAVGVAGARLDVGRTDLGQRRRRRQPGRRQVERSQRRGGPGRHFRMPETRRDCRAQRRHLFRSEGLVLPSPSPPRPTPLAVPHPGAER